MSCLRNALLIVVVAASASSANSSEIPVPAMQYASRSAASDERSAQPVSQNGDSAKSAHKGFRGSAPIRVSRTVHSERWSTLLAEGAERYFRDDCSGPMCESPLRKRLAAAVREARDLPEAAKLRAINSAVNHAIRYAADERLYGKSDHWAMAAETIARGSGDCEDQAILKMWMLRAAGVPASDVELLLLRDKARGVDHAVLAVNVAGNLWVLDNTRDQVSRDVNNTSYMPLLSLAADGAWIHGQRPHSPENRTPVARR